MVPGKDEIQIEADFSCPVINGELVGVGADGYAVYPDKVAIFRTDPETGKKETEEFDVRAVKLSGIPAGYFDSSKSSPARDRPRQMKPRTLCSNPST